MKRAFPMLNFLGVLALATLCGFQWASQYQTTQHAQSLQTRLKDQSSRVESQNRSIEGLTRDLDALRKDLDAMSLRSTQSDSRNRSLEQTHVELQAENASLRESLTHWTQAIQARDERLREFNRQLESLALERNAAIAKYNDLAKRLSPP